MFTPLSKRSFYGPRVTPSRRALPKFSAIALTTKAYYSEAFTLNAGSVIQVLGGTGFAMENNMCLFLKRAEANQMALGGPVYHRERQIQLLSTNFFKDNHHSDR